MPQRISAERHKRNIERLRQLVNTRPQDIVRDTMEGGAVSGAPRKYPLPSIGHRSGKLTITGYVRGVRDGVKALIVRCECNDEEYTVDRHNFKNFKSTRCNLCAKKATHQKRYWKYAAAMPDDKHRTRLLNRLSSAISRCHNPKCATYKYYGGRGICVHREWREDRTKFLAYVQTLHNWNNPTYDMDRKDNNGNYEPGNIRFVSKSENHKNRRSVTELEKEITNLRHRLRRAEKSLHNMDR